MHSGAQAAAGARPFQSDGHQHPALPRQRRRQTFRSPRLTALVEQALRANPDLAAAQATLLEAEENLRAGQGSLFHAITASGSATRERESPYAFGSALSADGKPKPLDRSRVQYQDTLQQVTSYFTAHGSSQPRRSSRASPGSDSRVQTQASFLAYMDAFWVMMLISLAVVPLALALRKVKLAGAAPRAIEALRDRSIRGQTSSDRDPSAPVFIVINPNLPGFTRLGTRRPSHLSVPDAKKLMSRGD